MARPHDRRPSRQASLRRLAAGLLLAGVPLFGPGCGQFLVNNTEYQSLPTQPQEAAAAEAPAAIQQTAYVQAPDQDPSATQPAPKPTSQSASAAAPTAPAAPAPAVAPASAKELPITFDTIFRLAEVHNARISLSREKLGASQAACAASLSNWLPKVYAGVAYYRHEGGIQNEDGTLTHSSFGALFPGMQIQSELDVRDATFRQVDAQRRAWQSKAELTRVSTEVLQEAATTYVDLLTARRGEQIAAELEKLVRRLLERAESTAKVQKGATIQVEALRTALSNQEYTRASLRHQGNAAAAKLGYLLGLPPGVKLVPVDPTLGPIELVDANPPTEALVSQALTNGPGVRELEGLLATVQGGIDKLSGPVSLLPTFQVNVMEGAFGAGPGSSLNWDNRLDIFLQARWDITRLLTSTQQKMQALSQLRQVHLNLQDLQGKLTAGVQESRDAILTGRESIGLSTSQLQHASETYRLSDRRLQEKVQGASVSEVEQTIRGLAQAHQNHLTAISNHNKAQVRLLLLLGAPNGKNAGH